VSAVIGGEQQSIANGLVVELSDERLRYGLRANHIARNDFGRELPGRIALLLVKCSSQCDQSVSI
jgi:hypothetical protein